MKGKFAAAVLFTAMGLASTAMAQDGQVNFTGKIIEAGCKINGSVTSSQDVKLGEVSKTAFTNAGSTAATTKFSLVLTACPAELLGKPVSVKYDGMPDPLNSDTSELPLGTESKSVTIASDAAEETNLDFFARYIATEDSVSGGDANGVVNFTLTYN